MKIRLVKSTEVFESIGDSMAMVCRDRRMDVYKSNRGTLSVRSLRQSSDGIDISELENVSKMIEASSFSVDYPGDLML